MQGNAQTIKYQNTEINKAAFETKQKRDSIACLNNLRAFEASNEVSSCNFLSPLQIKRDNDE